MQVSETDLIKQIQTIDGLEDVPSLIDLIDMMESGGWVESRVKKVLAILFKTFFQSECETQSLNDDVQRALNKLILMSDYRFNDEDLEIPLGIIANSEDESKVFPALNMLSKTFDSRLVALIEKAVHDKEQSVKNRAKQAIDLINSRAQY